MKRSRDTGDIAISATYPNFNDVVDFGHLGSDGVYVLKKDGTVWFWNTSDVYGVVSVETYTVRGKEYKKEIRGVTIPAFTLTQKFNDIKVLTD